MNRSHDQAMVLAVREQRVRVQLAREMQQAVGDLTRASMSRMDEEMPWFADLSAEHRAWISTIIQAGYNTFIQWYRSPSKPSPELTSQVFGNAPRSFARVVTLQQTVSLIRLSFEVAETDMSASVDPAWAAHVRENLLRYARELAFATAEVYAHAAEMRGAWDARLESLVVDSIMRGEADETVRTRAAALGWRDATPVAVLVGPAPIRQGARRESRREAAEDAVRRIARQAGLDVVLAVQGDRLVVVVGGLSDSDKAGALFAEQFGPGAVVVGTMVPDLHHAHLSAAAAVAGHQAAGGWPMPSGPLNSDDLLPERALDGDPLAGADLVEHVYKPLVAAGGEVMDTLIAYLDQGGSIEGTARVLFVHANTVRYRLRRILDVTGLSPSDARHAFTLRVAVVLGRLRVESAPNSPEL